MSLEPSFSLVAAEGAILEEILDLTHPVWGEGLDRASYGRYNAAQLRTPWGRSHLRRVALVDAEGRWVSTAKRYDLRVRAGGREVPALGIGALFTRPEARRRGAASALLRALLAAGAQEGARVALLFSEIGTGYYERFGFRAIPVTQTVLELTARPAAAPPAIPMRSGEPADLPAIAEMNQGQAGAFAFTLVRSPEYVGFAIAKKRLLAASGVPGHREVEFFVVEEGGRAAAYAVVLAVGDYWMVTECGDRDPSGARVGALIEAMLSRPGTRVARILAWLPPNFLPPQLSVLWRERPAVAMMAAPLGGFPLVVPHRDEVAWWHADAF
ncbi:MAG TPA: GNAT family N-acetyltransferase [Vicinamibacterales bacterium]|nr:GNAT family N-acetyltransferase [Acidobacteriota bacterium]HOC18180.1 GNAT family N-acetyltransferase [Vicinamibacterales bacterium]